MKVLLMCFFAGIFQVPLFTRGDSHRWRAGHSYPRPLPQEIMVDAVNYIGLVLLHAHNQYNENNIALSPYGATSVLVALGEGVQGTALDEILRATLLPLDMSITRVGLRDIHRHLKSYFIPQEGFLAGLTFSHENVTLKSSYEDILKFYGYDVDSFNNALYPDPYSSTVIPGSETSTESLSSSSNAANFSSSTTESAQTAPTTIEVPSTIENRDKFSNSDSTTMISTEPTITSTMVSESTTPTTVGTTTSSTSATKTTQSSTSSIAGTVTTVTPSTVAAATTTQVPSTPIVTSTVTATTPADPTLPSTDRTITSTESPSTNSTVTSQPATSSSASTTLEDTTTPAISTSVTTTSPTETIITPLATQTSTSSETTDATTTSNTLATDHDNFGTTILSSTTTTTVPLTSTVTQTTTPTSSTIDNENEGSTTSISTTTVSPITEDQSTRPVTTNLDSTTISSTTVTENSDAQSTADVTQSASTTSDNSTTESTQLTLSTTDATQLVSSTSDIGTTESTQSTLSTTEATQSVSSTSDISTTESTDSDPTSTLITDSSVAPSTPTTNSATETPSITTVSSTLTDQSTTSSSIPQSSAITVDIEPSTVGTGSTIDTSTTESSLLTLVTPAGDLSEGFSVNVRPSTVTPKSENIVAAKNSENGKNRITSKAPKRSALPRFRDDIELVSSLNPKNKSAVMEKVSDKSFISQKTSVTKNSIMGKKMTVVESTTSSKNTNEDVTNESGNKITNTLTHAQAMESAKVPTNRQSRTEEIETSASSTSDFTSSVADYSEDFVTENSEGLSSSIRDSSTTDSELAVNDKDLIVINKENTDEEYEDASINGEIVISEEKMSSELGSLEDSLLLIESTSEQKKLRTTRSAIDYLIARFHDSNPTRSYISTSNDYEPAKPTTFLVNGKIREPNINFMTYDTVLPYRYIAYLNALALTFPLDSNKYYLLLILPVDEMGIDNLVANMMSTTLKQIIYNLQPTRVKATIPSFMLKGYVVLTPTLQKLRIKQIFEPRHADFSRMTNDKDIYVTNIEQAVTVTIRNYVDPGTTENNQYFRRRGPVQFTADHPFLYFVMDSQIHVALMAGKIINPLNSRIR